MSRQQRGGGTGEVARGAGYAALLGALLIGVAVVIGIVLLQIGDRNDNGPATATKPSTTTTTTTTTKPNSTTKTTPNTAHRAPVIAPGRGEGDRPQRRRGGGPGRRHDERAQDAGLHERGACERLDRAHPGRQQRVLPGRSRPRGRAARDDRRRQRALLPGVPEACPRPSPRARTASWSSGSKTLSSSSRPAGRRRGPVARSIAVHAIARAALEHRAVGGGVDARARELRLVVHRAAALDRDARVDARHLERDVAHIGRERHLVLVVGRAAQARPRWRGTRRRCRDRAPCASTPGDTSEISSVAPVASAPASKHRSTRGRVTARSAIVVGAHHPQPVGVRGHDVGRVAAVRDDAVHLVAGSEVLAQQPDRDLRDGERVGRVDPELGRGGRVRRATFVARPRSARPR